MFDDFFDFEQTKARVYLLKEGDGKNVALISNSQILLVYQGQRHLFQLDKVRELKVQTQKLQFPLIVGGILAPFAFLSYFVHPLQPWIHLFFMIAGLLMFYIGFSGKQVLVVLLRNKEELVFHLPNVSLPVLAFVDHINAIISSGHESFLHSLIYLFISEEMEKLIFKEESANSDIFPLFAFTYVQLPKVEKTNGELFAFDPVTCGREISFGYDGELSMLRPIITGPLNPASKATLPSWIK